MAVAMAIPVAQPTKTVGLRLRQASDPAPPAACGAAGAGRAWIRRSGPWCWRRSDWVHGGTCDSWDRDGGAGSACL